MPRRNFGDGVEVVFEDFNKIGAAVERELYDRVVYEILQRKTNAVFGDSFLVEYATPTSVTIRAGLGFQFDSSQADPEPKNRLLYRPSQVTSNINAPHASLARKDIVCIKAGRVTSIQATRKVKSTAGTIASEDSDVQTDWLSEILIVAGIPGGSPTAPATPDGYLKIATLDVSAVSGLSGAGAVTDNRAGLPVAGKALLNTLGLERVTAGIETSLNQIVADVDALLKRGHFEYFDVDELAGHPAAPGATKRRLYVYNSTVYHQQSDGTKIPIGSGGGGGGGANWQPGGGSAPVESYENDEKVWLFEKGQSQFVVLWLKVPSSYIAGRPIKARLGYYSPGSANALKMQTVATLIRKNQDAITSTANTFTSTNGDKTLSVANQYIEIEHDLSSAVGVINGFAVSPGDLIKVQLTRVAPSGTEDTNDARFIPSATEVMF
jgi:hypothetical protein